MKIPFFAYIAAAFYLLPAFTGIKHWKSQSRYMKFFAIFCIYSVVSIAGEYILGRYGVSNQFLSNLYRLLQFECILFLYHRWIESQHAKDAIKVIGMLYFLIWSLEVSFNPFPNEFLPLIATSANALLLLASLVIMNIMMKNTTDGLTAFSIFWISSGIIIYSCGTISVLTMSNYILSKGMLYFNILWHINWGFTIIGNIFFARSFSCPKY